MRAILFDCPSRLRNRPFLLVTRGFLGGLVNRWSQDGVCRICQEKGQKDDLGVFCECRGSNSDVHCSSKGGQFHCTSCANSIYSIHYTSIFVFDRAELGLHRVVQGKSEKWAITSWVDIDPSKGFQGFLGHFLWVLSGIGQRWSDQWGFTVRMNIGDPFRIARQVVWRCVTRRV